MSSPPILRIQGSRSTPIPSNNKRIKQHTLPPLPTQINTPSMSSSHHPLPAKSHTLPTLLDSPPTTPPRKSGGGVPRTDVLRESRLHKTFQYQAPSPTSRLKSHRVGFAEYGPERGHPVFVIGGYGCTRLVGIMFEEIAFRFGIRMIWPERPGYGLSEECNPQEITALEWADVIIQLSNHIGIRQFSMIAQSVGTVFALAIAHRYKKRVMGPIFLISPWVSTKAANTFKWTRRLPAPLVAKTISLALDVMWAFSKSSNSSSSSSSASIRSSAEDEVIEEEDVSNGRKGSSSNSQQRKKNPKYRNTIVAYEEDELLASLDDDVFDLPTDFPTDRPLRHFVRPKHMSLYLAMNKSRMSEPYSQGQLCDVMVALEKYNLFGFSYSDIKIPVSAVWGDKDGLIPQKGIEYLANSLHDVRLKILESEGHDLVWKEGVMEWALRGIAERYCRSSSASRKV